MQIPWYPNTISKTGKQTKIPNLLIQQKISECSKPGVRIHFNLVYEHPFLTSRNWYKNTN